MKATHLSPQARQAAARLRAFTLSEVMIVLAIMSVVIGGVIASHLFGLRLMGVTTAKLNASQDARFTMGRIAEEIRAARLTKVGTGSLSTFSAKGTGTNQVGNALQIHLTTDTNSFIRYFLDSADKMLKRATNGGSAIVVMARSVTNSLPFTSENFRGQTLTNQQNASVIRLNLGYLQTQNPANVSAGTLNDYYRFEMRVTQRARE